MPKQEKILTQTQQNFLVLLSAFLFVSGLYYKYGDWSTVYEFSLATSFGILSLGFLFYKTEWFYFLLIALIPISVDMGAKNGAQINFPSEAMLVLLLPTLFLFQRDFRRSLVNIARHPITILLAIDLFIELVTAILGTHVDVSLKRVVIRLVFVLGFFGIINSLNDFRKLTFPWIAYILGLIPVMYFTLRNHIYYDFNPRVVFSICQPYFNDHTVYGACLAFILPFMLIVLVNRKQFNWKPYYIVLWTVLLGFVILSEFLALSRAAILSLGASFIFLLMLYWKVSFRSVVLGLVVIGAIAFSFSDEIYENMRQNEAVSNDGEITNHFSSITNVNSDASNLERINRWICAYRMFEKRPFTGFGPGTYQFEYNQFQTLANKTYISTNAGNKGNAHSEYLTYLSEMGIFGFLIFIVIVFSSLYFGMKNHYALEPSLLKSINLAILLGLVSFYFHGLFNSFIDQSKMGFLFYAGLGTIVAINLQLQKNKKPDEDFA